MDKKNTNTTQKGNKPKIFIFLTSSLLIIYFSLYFHDRLESSRIQQPQKPTEAQIEELEKLLGTNLSPSVDVIHFKRSPPYGESPRDYISYQAVAKFKSEEINKVAPDKIFSYEITTDWPPSFTKQLDLPKSNTNQYIIYRGIHRETTGVQIKLITSDQGQFSYAYYEILVVNGH